MTSSDAARWLMLAFAGAVVLHLAVSLWLMHRQVRHVAGHRNQVPDVFAARIGLAAHQRAADYTLAHLRLRLLGTLVSLGTVVAWTLLGGLDMLNEAVRDPILAAVPGQGGLMAYQLALVAAVLVIGAAIDLPLDALRTFGVEQRHGFNRQTGRLFIADALRGLGLTLLIGLPLVALMLWLMGATGGGWWLWVYGVWMGFQLLAFWAYPTLIAPLFNRFVPLQDDPLVARIQSLMARCGFHLQSLLVVDGSRRSAHANAYFTGLGRTKRVVFFDTLLDKLTPDEVEAVLAHELGHYRRRHIAQRLGGLAVLSLGALALLGWLSSQTWFYEGLGVRPNLQAPNDALALLLFTLVAPVASLWLSPLMAGWSRCQEFEADQYACRHADGRHLASALIKLHEENGATLTPDPWYVRFYYSHPPALQRLGALPCQP